MVNEAVDARELDIREDEIRALRLRHGHSIFPCDRLDHLIARAREEVAQDTPVVLKEG